MPEVLTEVFNTLTLAAQQEVCDFIMFLAKKQEREECCSPKEKISLERLEKYASSKTTSCPEGMDPHEYISKMREDRVFSDLF